MTTSDCVLWGLGRENHAHLRYLDRMGWTGRLWLYDEGALSEGDQARLSELSLEVTLVETVGPALAQADMLIRSPGVSPYKPEIQDYLARGGRVTTSTALALQALQADGVQVVGVTGTNGKSSTSTMLGDILKAAGQPCLVAGNIGKPLINYVGRGAAPADSLIVLELSSYQIFDLITPPAFVLFLNLYVDHVKWHQTPENYQRDKLSLLAHPGIARAVVHPDVLARLGAGPTHITPFPLPSHADREAGQLVLEGAALTLDGTVVAASDHMFQNAAAAATMAQVLGITPEAIEAGLRHFTGLSHRLQTIARAKGVAFVDDSISTTPESVLAALNSFRTHRIHLILGGFDRGLDYDALTAALPGFDIASLILMGAVGQRLGASLHMSDETTIRQTADLTDALEGLDLTDGDIVLMSPGAASFDSYRDYIHRGQAFAAEVTKLLAEDVT